MSRSVSEPAAAFGVMLVLLDVAVNGESLLELRRLRVDGECGLFGVGRKGGSGVE